MQSRMRHLILCRWKWVKIKEIYTKTYLRWSKHKKLYTNKKYNIWIPDDLKKKIKLIFLKGFESFYWIELFTHSLKGYFVKKAHKTVNVSVMLCVSLKSGYSQLKKKHFEVAKVSTRRDEYHIPGHITLRLASEYVCDYYLLLFKTASLLDSEIHFVVNSLKKCTDAWTLTFEFHLREGNYVLMWTQ